MAAYWEIAAHSVKNMFSMYSYLFVNLVFFTPRYLEFEFLSDYAFSLSLPSCTFLLEGELMTPIMGCVLMEPRSTSDNINKEDNLRLLHTR